MAERWEERNRNDFRDDRGNRDRDRSDRGVIDRAGDEVRSWFGDDDAARRRRIDEARSEHHDRDWSDRAAGSGERAWERTRDTVRDMTDRDRRPPRDGRVERQRSQLGPLEGIEALVWRRLLDPYPQRQPRAERLLDP